MHAASATFEIDPHLRRDTLPLGRFALSHVLLMNDPRVPWFILVPETSATELCDLDAAVHAELFDEAHAIARFVRGYFTVDKLNVAAIGNVVRQLHLHVVGRSVDDPCWPGVVWGTHSDERYHRRDLAALAGALAAALGDRFEAHRDG